MASYVHTSIESRCELPRLLTQSITDLVLEGQDPILETTAIPRGSGWPALLRDRNRSPRDSGRQGVQR